MAGPPITVAGADLNGKGARDPAVATFFSNEAWLLFRTANARSPRSSTPQDPALAVPVPVPCFSAPSPLLPGQ